MVFLLAVSCEVADEPRSVDEESLSIVDADPSKLVLGEKGKKDLAPTFRNGRTLVDVADKKGKSALMRLLESGCLRCGEYRVSHDEETPNPKENEAVVFAVLFEAGLRFPYHPFLREILNMYNLQLHHLTPHSIVQLSKFVWAMKTNGGEPCKKVFAQHYEVHRQPKKVIFDGEEFDGQYGCCTFKPRRDVAQLAPATKSKWTDQFYRYWFYVSLPHLDFVRDGKNIRTFPLRSRICLLYTSPSPRD